MELENQLVLLETLAKIAEQLSRQTAICGRMLDFMELSEMRNSRAEQRTIQAHTVWMLNNAPIDADPK